MVFTRQKARAVLNPEAPPRTHLGTNIREVRTPSRTVFSQEYNELFVQPVVQYSQEKECDELNYHYIGLNEFSTEDDMKKAYRNLARLFHPDKKGHSQDFDVMFMINEAREGL